ncbi:hypothetical protein NQ315_007800 [Exocentrus adspersus]|uniref:Caprin-1 dimerization domain-containing protein n=1 Tax=Exocentrus adspersus TaxID=1586481 RepID=A0AAV8W7Y0_9CUCU|nr:hypothetical protein NQ315_007800 [Exocentrus adspersus]
MPSAANVKIDKQVNSENSLAEPSSNLSPLRQAITIIEHKIRNLEKRKSKLDTYKELQNAGKELNADQKTAVAKYNEVINTLDFARDLCKQFLGIASVTEKEAKKSAKKEATVKYQSDLARLREILLVQDALNQMGNDNVREDFLHGRNGAAQLSESDLKLLDDLYPAVTPKHEAGNPTAFTNEVQAAAEHLLSTVEGKPKEVFGGSYSQIKEILGKIHESGYFDQAQVYENYVEGEIVVETEVVPVEVAVNHELPPPQDQQPSYSAPVIETIAIEPRPPAILPQPALETQPPIVDPTLPAEQIYYPQVPPQVQPQPQPVPAGLAQAQPPRPITEMLGTGSFFFLQESEIDQPLEQIPSQTFTNQNFSPHMGQPVPLPPTHFAPIPNSLPPTNHQVLQPVGNNGIDESLVQDEQIPLKDVSPPVNRGPPRQGNNQSYYQNNGYNTNNRPRQQNQTRNNASRPASNRH